MKQKMILAGDPGDDIICPDPEVPTELMWIWRSFSRLSEGSPWHANGLSAAIAGSIPLSAILEWGRYKEYDKDMVSYLDACIQEMDRTFLDHIAKKGK